MIFLYHEIFPKYFNKGSMHRSLAKDFSLILHYITHIEKKIHLYSFLETHFLIDYTRMELH